MSRQLQLPSLVLCVSLTVLCPPSALVAAELELSLRIRQTFPPGDANGDLLIDDDDIDVWFAHDGTSGPGTNDFNSWIDYYGDGSFGSGAGGVAASAAVPEPSSFTLLAMGGLMGLAVTFRRKELRVRIAIAKNEPLNQGIRGGNSRVLFFTRLVIKDIDNAQN